MSLNRRQFVGRSFALVCGGSIALTAVAEAAADTESATQVGRSRMRPDLITNGSFELPAVDGGIPEWTVAVAA